MLGGTLGLLGLLETLAKKTGKGKGNRKKKKKCNATNCPDGCCQGGRCLEGKCDSACEKHGVACENCAAQGEVCNEFQSCECDGTKCTARGNFCCFDGKCIAHGEFGVDCGGSCTPVCGLGELCCDGRCFPQTRINCGQCGIRCPTGADRCSDGACRCGDDLPCDCTRGAVCHHGKCVCGAAPGFMRCPKLGDPSDPCSHILTGIEQACPDFDPPLCQCTNERATHHGLCPMLP